jgi:hypothetical protein
MHYLLSKIEQTMPSGGQSAVTELYRQFLDISPHTVAIIGAYIKENPSEFVSF